MIPKDIAPPLLRTWLLSVDEAILPSRHPPALLCIALLIPQDALTMTVHGRFRQDGQLSSFFSIPGSRHSARVRSFSDRQAWCIEAPFPWGSRSSFCSRELNIAPPKSPAFYFRAFVTVGACAGRFC
jgi:hypothetical protein